MKRIYSIRCIAYKKLKNSEMSYIWGKTLVLSTYCAKFGRNNSKIFKVEKTIEILKESWPNC